MKKIHALQLTLNNIHAMPKKDSYKEFDNEKKFLRVENSPHPPPPPPLITFLMVRPLVKRVKKQKRS